MRVNGFVKQDCWRQNKENDAVLRGLLNADGGKGSGNFGHKSRPGQRGGSGGGDTNGSLIGGSGGSSNDKNSSGGGGSDTSGSVKSGTAAAKDHVLKNSSPEAQAAYDKARATKPAITKDMCEIASINGCRMEGLEFSVKTASSVEDKIQRRQKDYDNTSDKGVVESMGDLVRYTELCEHDNIAFTANKTVKILEEKGYDVFEVENKYLDKDPVNKGIHINAASPNGQKFELQVHSKESLAVKNKNHPYYEEARNVNTPKKRKEELN